MRGTSRGNFAGVPNALNLELFSQFFLKSLLLSLRGVRIVLHLHCSWSQSQSPPSSLLRLACCARGHGETYRCWGRRTNQPSSLRSVSPLRFAIFCAWACCVVFMSGETPRAPLLRRAGVAAAL
jgi:hypothetical protein